MSAVDWTAFPPQWAILGAEFAEMLPALAAGEPPRSPSRPWEWINSIAALRKMLGLTQNELGQRVSCNQKTISEYERGRCRPSKTMQDRLARVLLADLPANWQELDSRGSWLEAIAEMRRKTE